MNLIIGRTPKDTKEYPFHKHSDYEITFCLGAGATLKTREKEQSYRTGSIIIMPPGTLHSSVSSENLDCIYLRGEFGFLFGAEKTVILQDNANGDGRQLAMLIYNNRFSNREYVSSLCNAYTHFIATNMKMEDAIGRAVNEIVHKITENALNPDVDISSFLSESGYAKDYIRYHFKRITGKTPVSFLTDVRIRHACFLMETYGLTLPLSEVAEKCGYTDYVYFSKKFKSFTGLSPLEYKKR